MATTPASLVFLFSVIPAVLIVSSAILLDRAMHYEPLFRRCQIQIWMWLALSLASSIRWPGPIESENDDTNENSGGGGDRQVVCFAWAHLTVFFNLLAVMVEALQSRLIAPTRGKQNIRNVLQILPISSWWSMIVEACYVFFLYTTTTAIKPSTQIDTVWKFSLWTFLGTFLVLSLIRISANRRRKVSIDMQGIPTTMKSTTVATASDPNNGRGIMARFCGTGPLAASVNYESSASSAQLDAHCWLDERQWYTWTRVQTIQWFAQQISSNVDNDIYEEEKDMIVAILAPHRITGNVLDGLADISQLVSLRVPFGPACRLSDSIAELVERYPKSGRTNGARGRIGRVINRFSERTNNGTRSLYNNDQNHFELRASNEFIDLHDHEYNNELRSRQANEQIKGVNNGLPPQPPVSSHVPGGQHQYQSESVIQDDMMEEQHEKMNNMMKKRFGFELPKLKATDFLAVQKGLLNKANNSHETIPLSNDGMPQPDPFAPTTAGRSVDPSIRNDYANGITAPIPQNSHQQTTFPSFSIDNRNIPQSSSSTSIPEHILEGMQPEIREIAKRRPDLIETIWKQQQGLQQPRIPSQSPSSTALRAPTKRYTGLPTLPEIAREESMTGEDRVDAGDEYYNSDDEDEDERTSLINRDNINEFPARYKSTDKSILPNIT